MSKTFAPGSVARLFRARVFNSSPAFSPDGTRLTVTRSKQGNPDIYVVDIASGRQTRVTTPRC